MGKAINVLVLHPAKLIAVGLPKCGSSTLVEVFLRMSNFNPRLRNGRDTALKARITGQLKRAGMEYYSGPVSEIARMTGQNLGYKVFSIIRSPYGRIYSAYFNKLNRYTKKHRPTLYWRGRLAMLLGGPQTWGRVEVGNLYAHKSISFEDFLAELDRLGVDIDPHFDLQCRLLDLDHVHYDRLLRLEEMGSTLYPLLKEFGVPAEMFDRLNAVPTANKRMDQQKSEPWLTPANKALIDRLYAEDFARLDVS